MEGYSFEVRAAPFPALGEGRAGRGGFLPQGRPGSSLQNPGLSAASVALFLPVATLIASLPEAETSCVTFVTEFNWTSPGSLGDCPPPPPGLGPVPPGAQCSFLSASRRPCLPLPLLDQLLFMPQCPVPPPSSRACSSCLCRGCLSHWLWAFVR